MNHKKTIAVFTSNQGHFSLSEAIRQTLEPNYQVVVYQQNVVFRRMYLIAYRFLPKLFKLPYTLSRTKQMSGLAREAYVHRYGHSMEKFFEQHQPDLCISTYFMNLNMMEFFVKKHQVPFINVVANPATLHPIELSPKAEVNVVFDQISQTTASHLSPDSIIQPWGWFVRPTYEQPYVIDQIKKELDLPLDRLTITLAGGSEGNEKVLAFIPMLLRHPTPLNIVIINGSNTLLQKRIQRIIRQINPPATKKIVNLGFTSNMHIYLQAADLIIGKAGPNLLFEAVATHTPFLAISHISGQEDGNLELIKRYKLGYVEENTKHARQLLTNIIEQPQQLTQFQPYLKQLANYNKQTKQRLITFLKTKLN